MRRSEVEEEMRRRQEEIREENKLARSLAGWSLESKEPNDAVRFFIDILKSNLCIFRTLGEGKYVGFIDK